MKNCDTCKRVIHDLKLGNDFIFHDIKEQPITEAELDHLYSLTDSYEKIFSKIAMKYRILGLHEKQISEQEYKKYILQEYTFMKRPIMVIGNEVFIGSSRPVVTAAKVALELSVV